MKEKKNGKESRIFQQCRKVSPSILSITPPRSLCSKNKTMASNHPTSCTAAWLTLLTLVGRKQERQLRVMGNRW
ncbi:hypothetical protein CEXT_6941 [Caerostris extrusa]|uniref:Uncharacterized protein n=1 Tax=Caerostris extrusa TaxID=172846 RepID=A0AAV4ULY2_CAEEX|nr:hypothetical protein CEXT_6941 [Caerostris extrusa]